jgi:hypothetical protein
MLTYQPSTHGSKRKRSRRRRRRRWIREMEIAKLKYIK